VKNAGSEEIKVTLDQLPRGKVARVTDVFGGRGMRRNLAQLGIYPGSIIKISGEGVWRGPILVEAAGSRVALGRGIARRIYIETVE
jgi:ferrous iron transport protein A